MTKNDGKRGEYEVYREIVAWDYQGLQHHFSRDGQDDRTDHTLDLVVEKRLDRRADKEACLDVKESKMRRNLVRVAEKMVGKHEGQRDLPVPPKILGGGRW